MRRAELIGKVKALQPQLAAEGVSHIALFGSRARGDNTAASDVDILVEVDPGRSFSLLSLVGLEQIIEGGTGVCANAVMRRSLERQFAASIEQDVVELF